MGQFFYVVDELLLVGDKNTMINLTILLNETYEYVKKVKNSKEEMFHFKNRFKQIFENENNALPK